MKWLINILTKEARKRRFSPDDTVRYFTEGRKGKGRGIVLTPNFNKGTVVNYDSETKNYRIRDSKTNEEMDVHPRNLMPEIIKPSVPSLPTPSVEPVQQVQIDIPGVI